MTLVILDFNGTLYDPMASALMPGAKELLEALQKKDIPTVLVSKRVFGREGLPEQLGIAPYLSETLFVEAKTGELFKQVMERYGAKPEETFVIGDYPASEIHAGNEAGAFTIQFKRGRYSDFQVESESDRPCAVIKELAEALIYIH